MSRDETSLPVLYSSRHCPFSMRARMGIAASELCVELREVNLKRKPAQLLEVSPQGTVPALVFPFEQVIDQSMDILRYALKQNDPLQWVPLAVDTKELDAIVAGNEQLTKALIRLKHPERFEGEADQTDWAEEALKFFRMLEIRLEKNRYLADSFITIADIAVVPFVLQYTEFKPEILIRPGLKKLSIWVEGFLKSDLMRKVMEETKPWKPGDAPVYFP